MGTRTRVTYFSREQAARVMTEVLKLEHSLHERSPHMDREAHVDAMDRIEAVRLAVKRLSDICPD